MEPMKILAIEIEKEGISPGSFAPYVKEEAIEVLAMYEKGIVREIHLDSNHCAVIIMECESVETAMQALNSLPLVRNGLIEFEVRALHPYTGFSRLMDK